MAKFYVHLEDLEIARAPLTVKVALNSQELPGAKISVLAQV